MGKRNDNDCDDLNDNDIRATEGYDLAPSTSGTLGLYMIRR